MPTMFVTIGDLTLGATEASGVRWALPRLKGWAGSPSSSLAVTKRARAHGARAGAAYFDARHMLLSGTVSAPDADSASDAHDRLNDAVTLEDALFTVHESGRQRWCLVRREGDVEVDWITPTFAEWSVQVVALDPRKMGAVLTATTRLPSFTGGLVVPFTVPFSIDAVQVSGQVSLINTGNESGPVTIRIDGPVLGPIITHSSGLVLRFAPTANLGVGEFLEVDMDAHTVLAQGQATRANWIVERGWSAFVPGPNTWTFGAAAHSATAQMTVTATVADK